MTRGVAAAGLVLAALLAGAAPAPAAVPDPAGPGERHWTGTVRSISDGDTVYVDVAGDRTPVPVPVRNVGIQATETHGADGRPECGALPAKALMARLAPVGLRVRLSARSAASTSGRDPKGRVRLLRYVDRWDARTHRWVDVQLGMVTAGWALTGQVPSENSRTAAYARPSQRAMSRHLGLFAGDRCHPGPSAGAALHLWAHYEADGDDSASDGEWLRLRNTGTAAVPLAGWKLRDSTHTFHAGGTYFTFPAHAVVPAGATVTVYGGSGRSDVRAGRYYLGDHPHGLWLANPAPAAAGASPPAYPGKAVYLLDPHLDLRAAAVWPCLVACDAPAVRIADVVAVGHDEHVDLVTAPGATAPVLLDGVTVTNDGWARELDPGTVLAPGELLRVHVGIAPPGGDTRLEQWWGHAGPILEDDGDTVVLRTAGAVVLDTRSSDAG